MTLLSTLLQVSSWPGPRAGVWQHGTLQLGRSLQVLRGGPPQGQGRISQGGSIQKPMSAGSIWVSRVAHLGRWLGGRTQVWLSSRDRG